MPLMFDGDSHPEVIESTIRAHLEPVDPEITPFRLRMRSRDGRGTWIVSIAVPAGHECDRAALASAADAIGMRIEGYFDYTGDLDAALADDMGEPPMEDGLPLTNVDQFCAFCEDDAPVWVHPFDGSRATFSFSDERYTLPTFWTVCRDCEVLITEGRDPELAQLYAEHDGESLEKSTRVVQSFRAADLGVRPIQHVPTPRKA